MNIVANSLRSWFAPKDYFAHDLFHARPPRRETINHEWKRVEVALTPALSPRERLPPNRISCFWPLNPNRHNPLIINVVVFGFMGRGNRFARSDSTRGLLAVSPCRDHSPSRSRAHPMLPHSGSRSRKLSLSRAGEGWGEGGRSSHTQQKTRVNFCGQERDQFNTLGLPLGLAAFAGALPGSRDGGTV